MANKAVIKHLSDSQEKLCQAGDCFETGSPREQHENCEQAQEKMSMGQEMTAWQERAKNETEKQREETQQTAFSFHQVFFIFLYLTYENSLINVSLISSVFIGLKVTYIHIFMTVFHQ